MSRELEALRGLVEAHNYCEECFERPGTRRGPSFYWCDQCKPNETVRELHIAPALRRALALLAEQDKQTSEAATNRSGTTTPADTLAGLGSKEPALSLDSLRPKLEALRVAYLRWRNYQEHSEWADVRTAIRLLLDEAFPPADEQAKADVEHAQVKVCTCILTERLACGDDMTKPCPICQPPAAQPDAKAPERVRLVWYGGYLTVEGRERTGAGFPHVEYVRADLLEAAEDRAVESERQRASLWDSVRNALRCKPDDDTIDAASRLRGALEAAEARIAELTRDRNFWEHECGKVNGLLATAQAETADAEKRVASLQGMLADAIAERASAVEAERSACEAHFRKRAEQSLTRVIRDAFLDAADAIAARKKAP